MNVFRGAGSLACGLFGCAEVFCVVLISSGFPSGRLHVTGVCVLFRIFLSPMEKIYLTPFLFALPSFYAEYPNKGPRLHGDAGL